MIELFLLKTKEMVQIPTESIKWSGARYSAARKIEASILWKKSSGREVVKVSEGDTLLFKWKGKELFRGTVFDRHRSKSGIMTVTAYDMLQYLLLNKDVYVFTNKRADQIARRIMKDFEIPYSKLANTKHIMKSQAFTNETTLYDMILKPLKETKKQTGNLYYLASSKGKVKLDKANLTDRPWIIETGVNLIDYDYGTSISDSATRVKVVSGEEKEQVSVTVTDEKGKKKYGVLQHFEKVTDKMNKAQLSSRGKKILKDKKGVKKELSVDALGIPDLISNQPVRVIDKEIDIDRNFYIDADDHEFSGNQHTMNLKLIEENKMPEVG